MNTVKARATKRNAKQTEDARNERWLRDGERRVKATLDELSANCEKLKRLARFDNYLVTAHLADTVSRALELAASFPEDLEALLAIRQAGVDLERVRVELEAKQVTKTAQYARAARAEREASGASVGEGA